MAEKFTAKEFIRGSFWVYFGSVAVFAFGFVTNVLLARMLDPALFGVFSVCLTVVTVLSVFCDLGLNNAVTYFTARHAKKPNLAAHVLFFTKYKLALVAVICLAMYLFSNPLAELFHAPGSGVFFQLSAAYLALFSMISFFDFLLSGLKMFKQNALMNACFVITKFALAPLLVLYGFGVWGALAGFTASAAITTALACFFIRKTLRRTQGSVQKREIFPYVAFSGLSMFSGMILSWVDSFLIGILLLPIHVGFYRIAATVSTSVLGLMNSFTKVLFPTLTSLAELGKDRVQAYFDKVTEYSAFFAMPMLAGLVIIATPTIRLLFGSQYSEAAPALMLLSLYAIDILAGNNFILFNAMKMPHLTAKINLPLAVLTTILVLALIPPYGITGAAAAIAFIRALNFLITTYVLKHSLGISFGFKHLLKPAAASAIMAGAMLPFLDSINSIALLIAFTAYGACVYLAAAQLVGFDVKELFKKFKTAVK